MVAPIVKFQYRVKGMIFSFALRGSLDAPKRLAS